ncbi:hypothetical protein [Pseudorhodobacter turbinis]|uniref:hypothetical protein n=1 Tax=Pseudorhodobacter turbinis TaxID=2500533 RepID=UPI00143CC733|nr:hypothetical protein [Pseudorhodobacter turbinis]
MFLLSGTYLATCAKNIISGTPIKPLGPTCAVDPFYQGDMPQLAFFKAFFAFSSFVSCLETFALRALTSFFRALISVFLVMRLSFSLIARLFQTWASQFHHEGEARAMRQINDGTKNTPRHNTEGCKLYLLDFLPNSPWQGRQDTRFISG